MFGLSIDVLALHLAGGFLGGVVALCVAPPPESARMVLMCLRRLIVSLIGTLGLTGLAHSQAVKWLGFPDTPWTHLALAVLHGVVLWWIVASIIRYFEANSSRTFIDLLRDARDTLTGKNKETQP